MPAAPPPTAEASPPQADAWSPAAMTPSPTGILQPTTAVSLPQLSPVAQIASPQGKPAIWYPAVSPAADASPPPAFFSFEGIYQSPSPACTASPKDHPAFPAAGRLSPQFTFAAPTAAPSSPTAFASPPQADCLFPTPDHHPGGPSPNGLPSRVRRFYPSLDPSSEPPHHAVGSISKSSRLPGSFTSPASLYVSAATSSPISFVCGGANQAPAAAAAQLQVLPPVPTVTTLPPAGTAAAAYSLFDAFGKAAAAVPAAVLAADKASEGAGGGGWSLELPACMADRPSGLHQQETSPAHTARQSLYSRARKGSRQLHPQSLGPDQRHHSSRKGKGSRLSELSLGDLWSPDKLRYPSSRTARHQRMGRGRSLSETSSSRDLSQSRSPARSESAGRTRVRSRPAGSETPRRRVRSNSSPSRDKLHKHKISPASSESYGQAMGAFRARQLSRRSTQYSTFPSSFDSLIMRQQMLQTDNSRGAPGKHGMPEAASPRRSRSDSRLKDSSRRKSRSCIPLASPTRGRPRGRSRRRGKGSKRRPSVSSAFPTRHKRALMTSKSTRKRGSDLSWPRPRSPNRDLQHLSSSGRSRTGLFLADTDFTGGHLWLSGTASDCLCAFASVADQAQPDMALHACSLIVLCVAVP